MVGFRCAPVTAPKAIVNRVRNRKLERAPTRGPMKAALSNWPNWAVGGVGITFGDSADQRVM